MHPYIIIIISNIIILQFTYSSWQWKNSLSHNNQRWAVSESVHILSD